MRPRCVALVTKDAALYADLAGTLRERRIPSVSLVPGQRIPSRVSVVLTTPKEAHTIAHPRVLEVPAEGDRRSLWAAVESALTARDPSAELVLGIDPGPRPGYALLDGDDSIAEGTLESPEGVAQFAGHLRRRFSSRPVLFRVGSGDPLARDRIVNALLAERRSVEIVDERGTTPRGARRPRDAAAARAIARGVGRRVHERLPLVITPGEVANLQRLSREGSGGLFTIPRTLAQRVLIGEISFSDALGEAERRYRASDRHESPRASRFRELS